MYDVRGEGVVFMGIRKMTAAEINEQIKKKEIPEDIPREREGWVMYNNNSLKCKLIEELAQVGVTCVKEDIEIQTNVEEFYNFGIKGCCFRGKYLPPSPEEEAEYLRNQEIDLTLPTLRECLKDNRRMVVTVKPYKTFNHLTYQVIGKCFVFAGIEDDEEDSTLESDAETKRKLIDALERVIGFSCQEKNIHILQASTKDLTKDCVLFCEYIPQNDQEEAELLENPEFTLRLPWLKGCSANSCPVVLDCETILPGGGGGGGEKSPPHPHYHHHHHHQPEEAPILPPLDGIAPVGKPCAKID